MTTTGAPPPKRRQRPMSNAAPTRRSAAATGNPHSTIRIPQSAFTLLEVILALAILAGAVAVLGEMMDLAGVSSSRASTETRAQLLAATALGELRSGARELTDVLDEPLDVEDSVRWLLTVEVLPVDGTLEDLYTVKIKVAQDLEPQMKPTSYQLTALLHTSESESTDSSSDSQQN